MARFLFCLVVCLVGFIVNGCGQIPAQETKAPEKHITQTVMPFSHATPGADQEYNPIRLIIPAIHVDASVVPVGILQSGEMGTPAQHPWIDTGWFSGGPQPGERGSAVIDGHLDRPGGSPAVFWSLRDMHVGDEVSVVTTGGKTLHFHVTRIAFYSPQDAPLQAIFGDMGGAYLNLITCAGDWIPDQHQTTLRMVVYTSSD